MDAKPKNRPRRRNGRSLHSEDRETPLCFLFGRKRLYRIAFCNTGNEYPEIIRFVKSTENVTIIRPEITFKQVIGRYGFPLISKEQAHGIRQAKTTKSEKLLSIRLRGTDPKKGYKSGKIADRWQFLIKERFDVSEQCCEYLKKRPFARYSRETGEVPILGVMAGESDIRKQQYIRRGGV